MKKIYESIIVLVLILVFGINSVYAVNIEKIAVDENMLNMLAEKEHKHDFTSDIDTSKLVFDEIVNNIEFGNGIYLQVRVTVNGIHTSYPAKYKPAGFSNSPMYVYDEDLNYIKSIEFENYVNAIHFADGYFYFSVTTYGDGWDTSVRYYRTVNGDEWTEITYDEFMLALNKSDIYNGSAYTWIQSRTEEGGMITVHLDRDEYLIDSTGDICTIECENNKYVYSKADIDATDFTFFIRTKKSMENPNDFSLFKKYISIDGVSMFEIPTDIHSERVWNDDNYIYIGVYKDEAHCYKIPIAEISDCIKVKYNNKYLSFAANPTTENDRTLVPMRFLFEQMGAEVEWDDNTQTATVNKDGESISFSVDNTTASVNGEMKTMDVPARLVNDKTMIPVRFLSEELGYNVQWDEATKTVTITEQEASAE